VLDLELQRRRRRKGNEVLELFSLRVTVAAEQASASNGAQV
jgi:hypothetical protein